MNLSSPHFLRLAWALALVAPGFLAHAESAREVQSRFQQEMATCRSGASTQSRADCEREAYAARTEARRGGLGATDAASHATNALRRCDVFVDDGRRDCEARQGPLARTDGSVDGGGLLRQATTPATAH